MFVEPAISKLPNVIMKGRNKVPARYLTDQTLEAVRGKQIEKNVDAAAEERTSTECNPYRTFNQALKICDLASAHPQGSHFYQVSVPLIDRHCCFLAMK